MKRVVMLVLALLCVVAIVPCAFGAVRGESVEVAIDTVTITNTPCVTSMTLPWDATWIGGNSGASVVIKDTGTEVKRATGTGAFTWTPSTVGLHTLTYTTLIGGTAQSEVYSVTVYKEWKYTVTGGKATITETTHTTGNVTIPDSLNGYPVTEISANLFNGCSGLTSVTIPDSVTSVGANAFSGCTGITAVSVPWSLQIPLSTLFPSAYGNLTEVTMTGTPTAIAANQFNGCSALESVTIPNTVTSIGANAFSGCSSLTSVTIPASVTSVGANAFSGCTGITAVSVPWSLQIPLSTLFPSAYGNLTEVTMTGTPTAIAANQFNGCSALESITIPNTVTSIGANAFSGCSSLTSVTIPASVTSVGANAFSGCTGITAISVPLSLQIPLSTLFPSVYDNLTEVTMTGTPTVIAANQFNGCSALASVTIPNTVTSIGASAFNGCSSLASVTIPDSVTSIGANAFSGCSSLTSLVIPDSVTNIGANAFSGCSGLTSVTLKSGNMTLAQLFPAAYASLTQVTLSDGPTRLPNGFFDGCASVTTVRLPATLTSIGFSDLPPLVRASLTYDSDGFIVYQGWVLGHEDPFSEMLTIPYVKGIGASAFAEFHELQWVDIPGTVKYIGANAFELCDYLDNVVIPDSVEEIAEDAFLLCSWIESLEIGVGVKHVRERAFKGCASLQSVLFPGALETIGAEAFSNDWRMLSVNLPGSVTNIGANAFKDCRGITGVTVPAGVGTMQTVFPNAYAQIVTVAVPAGATSIQPGMFSFCTNLVDVTLPGSITSIGANAFKDCVSLPSLLFPAGVTNIGAGAFSNAALTNAYYLCMAAPACASDAFSTTPANMTHYVIHGSKGWDGTPTSRVLPELWRERPITHWTPNELNVTFDANGGTFANGGTAMTESETTDANYILPSVNPTRAGYYFVGWWTVASGGTQVFSSMRVSATHDHTLYAHWQAKEGTFSVTFDATGGTVDPNSRLVSNGAEVGELPTPTRANYTFDGWYTAIVGGTLVTAATIVDADVTYYAHWAEIQYTVTFDANGGTVTPATRTVNSGAVVGSLPLPTRANYSFDGWFTAAEGGTQVTATALVTGDVTYYAHWTVIQYTVTFDANGGMVTPATRTVNSGATVGELPTPTRANYTFDGWFTAAESGTQVTAATTVTGAVTYYAHWTVIQYTVTFNANGGTVTPATRTVNSGATVGELPTPTRANYTFGGWFTAASGGTQVTAATVVTGAVTYYAHWTVIQYTVTFNANGGTVNPATRMVNSGAVVGTLPTPTRAGFTFDGWFTAASSGTQVTAATVVTGAVTYYAHWTERSETRYCVIDLSGGANAASYPVSYLAEPPSGGFNTDEYKTTKLVLRRIGAGSYIMGDNQTEESHRVMLTKSFYIGLFEVTQKQYQLVTGSNPSAAKGDTRPVEQVKFSFIRGSSAGAQWPSSSAVDASSFMGKLRARTGLEFDLPTEAQWEYACRAGTTSTYNNGGSTTNDLNLLGRYSGNRSDARGGYTNAHTVVGSYQPNAWGLYDMHGNVREWCLDWEIALTYGVDPRGGASGTTSYRINRGGSWNQGSGSCGSSKRSSNTTEWGATDHGFRLCRTVYSEVSLCTVTFDANGGSENPVTRAVAGGTVVGELPTPTRTNYTFDGWFTATEGGTQVTAATTVDVDVTYYAHWTMSDPIPVIASDADVAGALAGSTDARLLANIPDKVTYDAYRAWADRRGLDHGTVKAHPRAWLSYALDATGLIARDPANGDLAIDSFEPTTANGRFEMTVSLKDVVIGPNALEANLAKVFGVEGCATLGSGFSTSGISVQFGTPHDGKCVITAGPQTPGTSFFMRVKMK